MAAIDRARWRVLEPLLDQAFELTAKERVEWLRELKTRAPDIAAEISDLLAMESEADRHGFLVDPLELCLSGVELGAYALERPLGQGGMGSVWLARRTDGAFEGYAAIKLLNLALLTDAGRERFRREGSLLARLTHPGIARLLDAGLSPNGDPYLILEHVDGRPIDAFATAHGLDLTQRLRLFLQVLAAVGHAHANLVIHRDLKPNNILVTGDGTVKLLDFGIAKLLDADGAAVHTALTAEGGHVLTPEFAAPEQVSGGAITTATDVYALGALLYLLVSNRHPTAEGCRTPAEAMHRLLETDPERLGLGDLDTILAKAMRKDARDRYQTVAAFADDLEHYLRHEPVSARPDSVGYRARKFLRRHRSAVTASALAVLALAVASGFSLRQMHEARRQRDAAEHDAMRSRALREIQAVLAEDSRGTDGQVLSTVERIALAERVLTRKYHREPWLVADVMAGLSSNLDQPGGRVAERQLLARARDVARRAGALQQVALTACSRAYSFWYDGVLDSARVDLAEGKDALKRYTGRADKEVEAVCLNAEGQLLVAEGRRTEGVAVLERAVALSKDDRRGQLLPTMYGLAQVLFDSHRYREALPYERRALAELDSTGYGDTETLANGATYLWYTLLSLGELKQADEELGVFVREQEAIHGVGHTTANLAFLYGWGKLHLGDIDSADVWIARAVRDSVAGGSLAAWLPSVCMEVSLEQRKLDDARRIGAQLPNSTVSRMARPLLFARLRRQSGDSAGALSFLERELRALSPKDRRLAPELAASFVAAGEWRLSAGDAHAADSLARIARRVAAVDSLALKQSAFVGRAELLRAQALRALGEFVMAGIAANNAEIALAYSYGVANRFTRHARALRDSL